MTTVDEMLKKVNQKKAFKPVKRRSWDYMNSPEKKPEPSNDEETEGRNLPPQKHIQDISEPLAKREQTVSKPLAKREQSVSNATPKDLPTKAPRNITTNSLSFSIKETELLDYCFLLCLQNSSYISPIVTTKELTNSLRIKPLRLRNLIHRLTKKQSVTIRLIKNGRDACRTFEFDEKSYDYFFKRNVKTPESVSKALANSVYSSSSYINTTTKSNKHTLPNEWQTIDFEDLNNINFSASQLKQLIDKNEPELVQESIYHFAFGLKNNPQTQRYANEKKALNVLMGVLRKGQGWTEPGYISPKEQAIKNLVEKRKAENERIEKMEQELFAADFEGWVKENDKQWLEDLIPPDMKKRESFRQATLRGYFKENVWEGVRSETN